MFDFDEIEVVDPAKAKVTIELGGTQVKQGAVVFTKSNAEKAKDAVLLKTVSDTVNGTQDDQLEIPLPIKSAISTVMTLKKEDERMEEFIPVKPEHESSAKTRRNEISLFDPSFAQGSINGKSVRTWGALTMTSHAQSSLVDRIKSKDEDAFEEANAAKRKWLVAGNISLNYRNEFNKANQDLLALKESMKDSWYDLQPGEATINKAKIAELSLTLKEAQAALQRAEQEEKLCEQAAREAHRKASIMQKTREAEINRGVHEQLYLPAQVNFTSTATLKSPWLPCSGVASNSVVRLFTFSGVGKLAEQYCKWPEIARQLTPSITVCPVQLPGKGNFVGSPSLNGDAHALAEAFIREVLDPVLKDGRPFALLGLCSSARVCYEIARRHRPVRVYVAGRAAPHFGARGQPQETESVSSTPDSFDDIVAIVRWAVGQQWDCEVTTTLQWLLAESELKDDPSAYLRQHAQAIVDDFSVGWTELRNVDGAGKGLSTRPTCHVHVYGSEKDLVWTPEMIGNSWNQYAPVAGGKCQKTVYKDLTHDQLCSPAGAPLLRDILTDLNKLVQASAQL